MKSLEMTAIVGDDRKMVVQLPADIAPGPHRIVVVVETTPTRAPSKSLNDLPIHDAELVDPNFAIRREDIYDESGR